ncbi:MAG TPA: hypothetical protein VE981_07670 [Planctomycetota bacterium]|nr:hypothetical protein [Planctomycetota bacterium]
MKLIVGVRSSLLLMAAALIPACGGSGGMGSGEAPMAGTVETAQKASPAAVAVDVATQAANDAIVDSGSPGTTSAKSTVPSPTSISFQSTLSLTVDLAATDASGQPRYPGASGILHVVATGILQSGAGRGSAAYAVSVTAATGLSFTDPTSGDSATLLQGAVWNHSLNVDWTFVDVNNWSITADSESSLSGLTFTAKHGMETIAGTVAGSRHVLATYGKTAGVSASSVSATAEKTITFTDSTGPHTVTIQMAALDSITLTVDGTTYGTFTRAQVKVIFHLECE